MASETSLYKQLDRSMPLAPLAIIALPSAREMGEKVSSYISMFRKDTYSGNPEISYHDEYIKDSYLVDALLERFPSGEGRAMLHESVRGRDVFLLVDVMNWTVTYRMNSYVNHMSPDDQ